MECVPQAVVGDLAAELQVKAGEAHELGQLHEAVIGDVTARREVERPQLPQTRGVGQAWTNTHTHERGSAQPNQERAHSPWGFA